MSYEEIVRDTDELIREIMLKNEIVNIVFTVLAVMLIVLMLIMIWQDRRDRKSRPQGIWGEYRPTVTETVQVDQYGTEFHRMDVPRKEV